MNYYEVAPTTIIRPGSDTFTYSSPDDFGVGSIVAIEVGKKQLLGVILRCVKKPVFETKQITALVEATPLPMQLLELANWLSGYYYSPLATVLPLLLPQGIKKTRRLKTSDKTPHKRKRTNFLFNSEQVSALAAVTEAKPGTFILQGVTGSGKTAVYIELASRALREGKSSVILVPEIALTSQIVADFSNHFDDIAILHSTLLEAERHVTWQKILRSNKPLIVIGARSALFAPLKNIGLVVVDEAHETSYKQENSPRYSALRAATMLGRLHDSKVIFGSATPSVSDRYLAEQAARPIIKLDKPARKNVTSSSVSLVDMTNRANFSGHRFLSKKLLDEIESTLATGKQSLVFHNRRGSASTTLCESCGWTANCGRCFIPLTLHSDNHTLRCHICASSEKVPSSCPVCHNADIIFKGFGTKLIESELKKLFPTANIARFDADNSDKDTVNARYSELYSGEIDIAIGTQVVAKGLDLPNLRTVGVIQADSGLALPDFNSSERTFQLLAQVVGRVGRSHHASQVVVQSYQPTHPSIAFGLSQDYESFYKFALAERKKAHFPPYTHLLKLVCSYKTEASAIKSAQLLAKELRQKINSDVSILGPVPAFYERQRDNYRWQLVLKSPKREYLLQSLKLLPPTHWQYELDPTSLL